jgi:hypothetical protein
LKVFLASSYFNTDLLPQVLSRPRPVKTIVPGSPVLAMLVNTNSQNNLSNAAIKNEFEVELARFYRNSESLPVTKTVNATVSIAYSLR